MRSVLVILVSLWSASATAQSPWSAEKGKGFAQLGSSLIGPYHSLFIAGSSDDFVTSRQLIDFSVQCYGAYGLGNGWQVAATIPLVYQSAGDLNENPTIAPSTDSGKLLGVGNLQFEIKKELYNKQFIISTALTAEIHTSVFDENTGLRTGYGAFGLAPSLIIGKGWEKYYVFINTGPTFRNNAYSTEWRIQAEAGYNFWSGSYIMFNLYRVESFRDGDIELPVSNLETGFYVNNQSFFAFGPKLLLPIRRNTGITAAAYDAFGGHQVAKSPSWNIGFYYKW